MGLCLPGAAEPRALVERRRPRYEQLKDALREGILSGRYAVGARLPPVRRLREEYGVSFPTAHRAMRELAAEGLVEAGPGSKGTTVVRNEPPVRKRAITIACLLRPHRPRNEEDNFAVDMIQGIRDGVSAHGYRFVYHCLDEVDYDRRMRDLAQEEWVCGVLLDQRVPLGTIEALAASGLPAVLINRREAIAGLSSVAPDYERMGREGVRMLARKGYRRVAFAALYDDMATDGAPCGEQYPLRALARGFSAAAGAHGFRGDDLRWITEPRRRPLALTPAAYGLPRRKPAGWKRLGFILDTDRRAAELLRVLAMTDLVPGKDVGLIGCYDLPAGQRSRPQPSTWRVDPAAVGEGAAALLVSLVESPGQGASSVVIPAEFVDRGTF